MPEIKNIIRDYKLENQVILPGAVEQSLGPDYLAACDILICPQIENPDGTKSFYSPIKLFEYMAMGKPIIASKLGQIEDILKHEKTALLITPGSETEIVTSIHRLINDDKLCSLLSENARKEVVSKYTWNKHVERILEKMKAAV
jgi:glycosyltransferase involved in cell wall biosynthesis